MILYYSAQQRLQYSVEAACPGGSIDFGANGQSPVFTPPPGAPPAQVAAAQKVVNDFVTAGDWRLYQTRALVPIRNDLNALTLARRHAIFNDLWSIPAGQAETRLLLDNGPNAPAIWPHYMLNEIGILNSTQLDTNQTYVTCLYVQDLPFYLVNPSFDPTLNIPGIEPMP